MSTRAIRVLLSALLLLFSVGASSCTDNGGDPSPDATHTDVDAFDAGAELPDEAYARDMPTSADEVDWATFQQMLESGDLTSASIAERSDQQERADEQQIRDEQTIEDTSRVISDLNRRISAPDDDLERVGDNVVYGFEDTEGSTSSVVLMGPRWQKHTLAEAIRVFPTRENQFETHKGIWNELSPDLRSRFELTDPDDIENSPEEYSVDYIRAETEYFYERAREYIEVSIDPMPANRPDTCELEVGKGEGTDRTGGECEPDETGLYSVLDWPNKWYTTCVKNQATRGTCAVMSSTSAIEMLVARKHDVWTNLSEQALYNRALFDWNRDDFHDGAWPKDVLDHMQAEGWLLPFEEQWNYNPSYSRYSGVHACIEHFCDGSANLNLCKSQCRSDPSWWYYLSSCEGYDETCGESTHQSNLTCAKAPDDSYHCGYSVPQLNPNNNGYRVGTSVELLDLSDLQGTLQAMVAMLLVDKPVVVGMPLWGSFWDINDNGGYVPMPDLENDGGAGAHAMHVLWFVRNDWLADNMPNVPEGAGGGYFILKNSWGRCSGDGGYLYLPFQYVLDYATSIVSLTSVQ